ncbi:MAG: PAS domain-containing methyl-accepting chemotaxis protein [Mariprofundaceae bacterium]|nr:PAS domain-containing methyl-accepting chemotaxis protein [Mariprofundaceae bacterium]
MRNNQPITQLERKMNDGDILVSRTDLKGRIVYANQAFCDIGGFTAEELQRKAHNIVRHPDMPAASFQDLWDTIAAEKPWTGVVKNRCKNGDYYWVVANVSPEYDRHSKVSGYISVRTKPTQAQMSAADSLYKQVNAGKAKLPSSLKYSWLKTLKLKTIILAAASISLVTLFLVGSMFINVLTAKKDATELRVAAVPLIGSIRNVLEYLPQHRGMGNAYLQGNKDLIGKIMRNEGKVDTSFQALLKLAKASPFVEQYEKIRSIQQQWSNVEKQWQSQTAKESFRLHSQVIEGLMSVSSDLMHRGKLSTDPSLAIAHLSEFISETIPMLNEYMGRLRGLGSGIAVRNTITNSEHDTMLELYVKTKMQSQQLLKDTMHVIQVYNPALKESLASPMSKLTATTQIYLASIQQKILNADQIDVDSSQYFSEGTQSIAASLFLYDAMDQSLIRLLNVEEKKVLNTYTLAVFLTLFGIIGSLFLSLLMVLKTFKPLQEIVEGMQRIVEGNYGTLPVKHGADEMGAIVDAMTTMQSILQYEIFEGKAMAHANVLAQRQANVDKAKAQADLATAFEDNVGSLMQGLASAVGQVDRTAHDLDDMASSLTQQSTQTVQSVDTGSNHVNSTAAAIEEMSVSIGDVSRQVVDMQVKSVQAVKEAESSMLMMKKLKSVADEVGSIVGAISDIAEQTNLLALNASIEAARAGDAGRGFSVVAGEVKELANQTSQATLKIREQVTSIQEESEKSTEAMEIISETIQAINQFTSHVVSAMDEQSQAGREISNAAQQADMSMTEANASLSYMVESAGNVAQSSGEMLHVASSMLRSTEEVQEGIQQFIESLRKDSV